MRWPPEGKLLVPVDFSEQSLAALDTAVAIAGDPHRVYVIHVLYESPAGHPGYWNLLDRPALVKQAEAELKKFLGSDPKRRAVSTAVVFGDPGYEIAVYGEDLGAELIVMPSHGRRGLSRMLIGSVTERVLRMAHCPVLVLRGLKRSEGKS